jgi:hypothetical protein
MIMKKLILVFVIAFTSLSLSAQYKWGIGVGLGAPSGISVKTFTNSSTALDFTVGWWVDYMQVTGMYEIHKPLADQLNWYIGPGAHLGLGRNSYREGKSYLGIDGVVGLEWKGSGPVAVSLDFRPRFDLIPGTYFEPAGQLGVRYTFGR